MANPLARVVMTNLVDMDKKENNNSSRKYANSFNSISKSSFSSGRGNNTRMFLGNKNYSNNSNNSSDINLSPSQENLLLGIIGGERKSSGGRNNMAKSYKSNSNTSVKGLKTIEALAGISSGNSNTSSSSEGAKVSSRGKSSYGQKCKNYGKNRSNVSSSIKAISFEELAGGNIDSSSSSSNSTGYRPVSSSKSRQQGTKTSGMYSLEELADEIGVKKEEERPRNESSSVRSSVIGNLEGYVPKVSLDSIGKSSKF
ncbi:MAG: hypothetical protein Q4P31_06105 [Andreesenia angusta]|nr:hypothetical protein [Andreesenia angusta]